MLSLTDALLFLFSGLVVIFDVRERRIPNWLNFLAIGVGFLLHGWNGVSSFLNSFYGCLLGLGLFIVPFVLGWIGAGDVKLMGALGALLGVTLVPRMTLYAILAGGVLALFSLVGKKVRVGDFTSAWLDFKLLLMTHGTVKPESARQRSHKGARTVPYGVAIIVGALIAVYYDSDGQWAGF